MDFRETEAMNEASVMEERATVDQEAETATAGAGGSKSIDARRFDVVTDPSRDALLTDFGKETLEDRYLLPNEGYQDLFARVASAYADDQEHAQRLYDAISKLWFMPATPVLSNGGTGRGLPISCYLNSVDDSLEGIVNTWNENVWLASRGGGIGTYWGNVRGIGEPVGLNGKTSGIIPFVRVMDSLTLAISQGGITIIFLSLVGATVLFHFVWRRIPDAFDYILIILNASSYFLISYGLMVHELRNWMGLFTLLLALFYGALTWLSFLRHKEHPYLPLMLSSIAIVFLIAAVPIQLNGPWISVGWAVQAVVLIWISSRLRMREIKAIGIAVLILMIIKIMFFDTHVGIKNFQPVINNRVLAFATVVAALYISAYFFKKEITSGRVDFSPQHHPPFYDTLNSCLQLLRPRRLFLVALILANFLTIWVVSAEIISIVDSNFLEVSQRTANHIKSLSLSLFWAGYASVVTIIGTLGRWPQLRMAGLGMLSIPILKLFLVDTFQLDQGYRVAAYLSLGAILLTGGFLYQRYGYSGLRQQPLCCF